MTYPDADSYLTRIADSIQHYSEQQRRLGAVLGQSARHSPNAGSLPEPCTRPFADVIDTIARPALLPAGEPNPAVAKIDDPFDSIIAAVSGKPTFDASRTQPLPPSTRFMVRVSEVEQPHRKTKRNYDYFTDLNAALAAKAEEQRRQRES